MKIRTKTPAEIAIMRQSANILASVFEEMAKMVDVGITTKELDAFAYSFIRKQNAKPSFKGYKPGRYKFPATLCTSINEEVIHGIPSNRKLENGDIIGIDCGVFYRGYHSDAARTFMVGNVDEASRALVAKTEEAFFKGVETLKAGTRLGDLGHTIQKVVEDAGYSVVRQFAGHGIGSSLHEPPQINNYGKPGKGVKLPLHCVLAIEPMVNAGTHEIAILKDRWTVVTTDEKRSAHYENTVLVTEDGYEILTLPS